MTGSGPEASAGTSLCRSSPQTSNAPTTSRLTSGASARSEVFTPTRLTDIEPVYPHGWRLTEHDVVRTTYHRSKFENSDGRYFVLIDWSPGIPTVGGPRDLGEGYEMISYRPVTLATRRVHEWRFRDNGKERVNYLFAHAGDGYAVLAGGDDVQPFVAVARQVANSLAAR